MSFCELSLQYSTHTVEVCQCLLCAVLSMRRHFSRLKFAAPYQKYHWMKQTFPFPSPIWYNSALHRCTGCCELLIQSWSARFKVALTLSNSIKMLPVKQQFYVRRRALPSVWETIRRFSEKDSSVIGEDLIELMHGRKNLERRDSVSNELLLERQAHQLRIKSIVVNKASVRLLTSLGIGSKKRRHAVYKLTFNQFTDVDAGSYKKSQTGSGKTATRFCHRLLDFLSKLDYWCYFRYKMCTLILHADFHQRFHPNFNSDSE